MSYNPIREWLEYMQNAPANERRVWIDLLNRIGRIKLKAFFVSLGRYLLAKYVSLYYIAVLSLFIYYNVMNVEAGRYGWLSLDFVAGVGGGILAGIPFFINILISDEVNSVWGVLFIALPTYFLVWVYISPNGVYNIFYGGKYQDFTQFGIAEALFYLYSLFFLSQLLRSEYYNWEIRLWEEYGRHLREYSERFLAKSMKKYGVKELSIDEYLAYDVIGILPYVPKRKVMKSIYNLTR